MLKGLRVRYANITDVNDSKKLCLEQLQTSKRQLVWNREHDLRMIGVERAEVSRMELGGQGTPESIAGVRKSLDNRESAIKNDIGYAKSEIDELDKEIAEIV